MATTENIAVQLRILIADDHPSIRRIVRQILDGEPHLTVVGEAVDGSQAVQLAASLKPDLVILNVTMPNMTGIRGRQANTRKSTDSNHPHPLDAQRRSIYCLSQKIGGNRVCPKS